MPNKISFQDTHVYQGCTALLDFVPSPNHPFLSVTIEFNDGILTRAEVEALSSEELILSVDSYTTLSGTFITAKNWQLTYDAKAEYWNVKAKLNI